MSQQHISDTMEALLKVTFVIYLVARICILVRDLVLDIVR